METTVGWLNVRQKTGCLAYFGKVFLTIVLSKIAFFESKSLQYAFLIAILGWASEEPLAVKMDRRHDGYYQFRRKLIFGYATVAALLIALLGWKTSSEYRAAREMTVALATHSASAMAAHTAELIAGIDQPLADASEAIGRGGRAMLSPAAVRLAMAAPARGPDSRYWLFFIDADGRGLAASDGSSLADMSFKDRPFFFEPAHSLSNSLFVGWPTIGKRSNRPIFFLSRRVTSPSRDFMGVVAAAVDAEKVSLVFEQARQGADMSISLITAAGVVVARAPLFEASFSTDVSATIRRLPAQIPKAGSFEAIGPIQGGQRIFAYHPVGPYPLVIVVGLSSTSWNSALTQHSLVGLGCLGFVLIVGMYSGNLALRRYWHLEEAEEQQRRLVGVMNIVQKRLATFARTDPLTELPNRIELYDRLRDGLARCRRNGARIACLYLDVDRFKEVNDTLGHHAGDEALKEFSRRLVSSVRESDFVARLAGDEFVIVLESLEHPGEAERVASKIVAAMEPEFELVGQRRRVTTSIGIVVADSLVDTPDSMLSKADQALYEAKRQGRNRASSSILTQQNY